ncbi:MAG: T9SS type A sorting domain-containing protein, partial [Calditrichota bacterium]
GAGVSARRFEPTPTGSNMSVLLLSTPSTMSTPSTIGVFTGDRLVGAGRLQDGACGIAVWGDDALTPELDGARAGDILTVKVQLDGVWRPMETTSQAGEGIYTTDGLWVVNLTESAILSQFGLTEVYPNPFNSVSRLSYNLLAASRVELGLYDLEGRLVRDLASGIQTAGIHTQVLDGAGLSSGVYVLQLRASGEVSRLKVTLVK